MRGRDATAAGDGGATEGATLFSVEAWPLAPPSGPPPAPVFSASQPRQLLRLRVLSRSASSNSPGTCLYTSRGPICPPALRLIGEQLLPQPLLTPRLER